MYTLYLLGFLNGKRIKSLTIEQARAEFTKAKTETYQAHQGGQMRDMKWTAWELYQDGNLIKSGEFNNA